MFQEQERSQEEAARHLGIPKGTLANWVAAARGRGQAKEPGTPSAAEVKRLRKERAEARLERDILKKRRRTSRKSRGEVRLRKALARRGSGHCAVPGPGDFSQRILCLAWSTRGPSARAQEDERLKVSHYGGAPAHSRDL